MKLERTRYPGVYRRRGRYEIAFKDSDGKWHRKPEVTGSIPVRSMAQQSQKESPVRGSRIVW